MIALHDSCILSVNGYDLHMIYVLGILISIAILNAQIWLVSELFSDRTQRHHKLRLLWMSIGMGALVASLLRAYSYFTPLLLASWWWQEILGGISMWTDNPAYKRFYSLFIIITGWLISLLFARRRARWGVFFVGITTVVAAMTWGVAWLLAWSSIGLLIIKATGEEILKISWAQALPSPRGSYSHDIIVMSLIAWLGFALCENIIYFLSSGGSWVLLLTRSLTTSLLHAIFTGCVGYVLSVRTQGGNWVGEKPNFITYVIAFAVGIILHSLYNISMTYAPLVGGIVFVIGWYLLLSYILYKSDRLYYSA